MKLSKENIREWKTQLNKEASEIGFKNYEESQSDEEWLEDFEGYTPSEVLTEDCFNCYND